MFSLLIYSVFSPDHLSTRKAPVKIWLQLFLKKKEECGRSKGGAERGTWAWSISEDTCGPYDLERLGGICPTQSASAFQSHPHLQWRRDTNAFGKLLRIIRKGPSWTWCWLSIDVDFPESLWRMNIDTWDQACKWFELWVPGCWKWFSFTKLPGQRYHVPLQQYGFHNLDRHRNLWFEQLLTT